jgi:hypothetical protein
LINVQAALEALDSFNHIIATQHELGRVALVRQQHNHALNLKQT